MKTAIFFIFLQISFFAFTHESNHTYLDSIPVYSKEFLKKYVDSINEEKRREKKKQQTKPSKVLTETVPVYPGCERGNNEKKRKCMSEKISKFIKKEFDPGCATGLGLSGKQRVSVIFKIDTFGRATGIRARAAHLKLEREAIRVIKMLPVVKPGTQDGKKVIVPYSLPIFFQVN